MTEDQIVRRAERLLNTTVIEALRRTAVLLVMIANGEARPEAARVASRDLVRLLDAVGTADRVSAALRRREKRAARRVSIH
jgi:hypothetical protein